MGLGGSNRSREGRDSFVWGEKRGVWAGLQVWALLLLVLDSAVV